MREARAPAMRILNRLGAEVTGRGHSRQVGNTRGWRLPGRRRCCIYRCDLQGMSHRGLGNYEDLDLLRQDRAGCHFQEAYFTAEPWRQTLKTVRNWVAGSSSSERARRR